jgi:hypothetical protein
VADFLLENDSVLTIDAVGACVRTKAGDVRFYNPDQVVCFGNQGKTFYVVLPSGNEHTYPMKTEPAAKGAAREFAKTMSSAKQSCSPGGTIPDPAAT